MTKVDLITGFLGAGKTTFIIDYAKWLVEEGVSVAVIENEFGAAGCDGAILKDIGLDVSELSGGCICCSLKVNFAYALLELSHKVERVIVEPSGIFSPVDFFEVMQSPMLRGRCEVGLIAAVVDPNGLDDMLEEAQELLRAQAQCAGAVLVSMTGGMMECEIGRAKADIAGKCGDGINIVTKPWDAFTGADFESLIACGHSAPRLKKTVVDHASLFNSATLRPKGAFEPEALRARLGAVMRGRDCGRVLRIKGNVPAEGGGMISINCTPSHIDLKQIREGNPVLNVIGKNLVRANIQHLLFDQERGI